MCYQPQTVLVLEDDFAISELLCCILKRQGYNVLAASNASEAIRIGELHAAQIDLVMADVLLGRELASPAVIRLRQLNPAARVLFLSGLTLEGLYERGYLEPAMMQNDSTFFLQKPFLPKSLIRAVEAVLARDEAAHPTNYQTQEVRYHVRRAY